jgi:hypothetical protein
VPLPTPGAPSRISFEGLYALRRRAAAG